MSETKSRILGMRKARRDIQEAHERREALVREEWPEGTWLEVPYGNGFVRGVVVRHGYSRLCLRLDSNGREFWVDAWHLYRERI